jgi:queuine tRNA-ribosyltransferase
VRSQEILAYTLLSIHNITELIRFTQKIRESILSDRFATEFGHWLEADSEQRDNEENNNF